MRSEKNLLSGGGTGWILVLGLGRSGLAAARLLVTQGYRVRVYDEASRDERACAVRELAAVGVPTIHGAEPDISGDPPALAVVSPGISLDRPALRQLRAAGVPVLGEMELGSRFLERPYAAVTGTNGKTTTASLLAYILEQTGHRVVLAGNVGNPLCGALDSFGRDGIGVLEVSSYQLETVEEFHPCVAVITNITPDHLARHGSMEHYTALKARILGNLGPGDTAVLNHDDPRVRALGGRTRAGVRYFSVQGPVDGAFAGGGDLWLGGEESRVRLMGCGEIPLPGRHNVENTLAAACAARALGVEPEAIRSAVASFPGVPHRQEVVAVVEGVTYINDSKATNSEAAMMALDSYQAPVVLILGGSPKQAEYGPLMARVRKKGAVPVLVGETAGELEESARRAGVPIWHRAAGMEEAVALARREAVPGGIVLLSPACPSFDMFRDYEHRGDVFREIVHGYESKANEN